MLRVTGRLLVDGLDASGSARSTGLELSQLRIRAVTGDGLFSCYQWEGGRGKLAPDGQQSSHGHQHFLSCWRKGPALEAQEILAPSTAQPSSRAWLGAVGSRSEWLAHHLPLFSSPTDPYTASLTQTQLDAFGETFVRRARFQGWPQTTSLKRPMSAGRKTAQATAHNKHGLLPLAFHLQGPAEAS